MQAFSVQQIKYEFLLYMKEFGGDFVDWHIGVSSTPHQTLTDLHKVDLEQDYWIFKPALTFIAANTIKKYFINVLGSSGNLTPSDNKDERYVYIFRKIDV